MAKRNRNKKPCFTKIPCQKEIKNEELETKTELEDFLSKEESSFLKNVVLFDRGLDRCPPLYNIGRFFKWGVVAIFMIIILKLIFLLASLAPATFMIVGAIFIILNNSILNKNLISILNECGPLMKLYDFLKR